MVHVYEVGAHLEDWYRANSDQAVSDYWPETQWERQKGQRNSGGKALVYTAHIWAILYIWGHYHL